MREADYLDLLDAARVQGILIAPVDPDSSRLRRTPVPRYRWSSLTSSIDDTDHCSVAVNDILGGRLAIAHLLELGHPGRSTSVARTTIGQVIDRRDGARRALHRTRPAPRRPDRATTGALTVAEGRSRGRAPRRPARAAPPTAAFCANDLLALGLLQQSSGPRPACPRGPRHRRLRRHRVRRGRRRPADLGASAPRQLLGAPPSCCSTSRPTRTTNTSRLSFTPNWSPASTRRS